MLELENKLTKKETGTGIKKLKLTEIGEQKLRMKKKETEIESKEKTEREREMVRKREREREVEKERERMKENEQPGHHVICRETPVTQCGLGFAASTVG